MDLVVGKQFEEHLQLSWSHRLNDESLIVREDEEGATCAGTLTCLEHHVTVRSRVQGVDQHVSRDAIYFLDALEELWCVNHDLNHSVNDDLLISVVIDRELPRAFDQAHVP